MKLVHHRKNFMNMDELIVLTMLPKCVIQAPTISAFASGNAPVGTSIGERVTPVAAMDVMVSVKFCCYEQSRFFKYYLSMCPEAASLIYACHI